MALHLEAAGSSPQALDQRSRETLAAAYPLFAAWAHRRLFHVTADSSESQDLIQDAFLVAFNHLESFAGRSPFEVQAWLRTTFIRIAAHHVRDRQRAKAHLGPHLENWSDAVARGETPGDQVAEDEEVAWVFYAYYQLPTLYRRVIRMHHLEGQTYAVIGAELERSEEAIRKINVRALVHLRRELKNLIGSQSGKGYELPGEELANQEGGEGQFF